MKNPNIPENISEYEIDSQFGEDDDREEEPSLTIDEIEIEEIKVINQEKKSYE